MSGGYVTWPSGQPERAQHTNSRIVAWLRVNLSLPVWPLRRMCTLRLVHGDTPCNPIVEARICERYWNRWAS